MARVCPFITAKRPTDEIPFGPSGAARGPRRAVVHLSYWTLGFQDRGPLRTEGPRNFPAWSDRQWHAGPEARLRVLGRTCGCENFLSLNGCTLSHRTDLRLPKHNEHRLIKTSSLYVSNTEIRRARCGLAGSEKVATFLTASDRMGGPLDRKIGTRQSAFLPAERLR